MAMYLLSIVQAPRNQEHEFSADDDEKAKDFARDLMAKMNTLDIEKPTEECCAAILYEKRHVHTW